MSHPRQIALLSAAAALLVLPLAACSSADADEETTGTNQESSEESQTTGEGSDDSVTGTWRETAREVAFDGYEGCADFLPDETVEIVADITGPDVRSVIAVADEDEESVTCFYGNDDSSPAFQEVSVNVDHEIFSCQPAPKNGPESHADAPTSHTDQVDGEEVEMRLSHVVTCAESGVGTSISVSAFNEGTHFDALENNDLADAITATLLANEETVVADAKVLRQEALAAD